jgi:hypothetical protein
MHSFIRRHMYTHWETVACFCSSIDEQQMQEYNKGETSGLRSRFSYSMNDLPLDCYLKASLLALSVREEALSSLAAVASKSEAPCSICK